MAYQLEKLPSESIIIMRIDPDDRSAEGQQAFVHDFMSLLEAQSEPVFIINVLPTGYHSDMNDILEGSQMIRNQSEMYRHPKIRGMAAVTNDETLKLAYRGLSNEVFGGIFVQAFDTFEEALKYVRSC